MQESLGAFLARGRSAMTTQAVARRRRPRGAHLKRSDSSAQLRKLPEYLEAHEVEAIIRAKLLMLEQWRAGLRIAEALALEVADLSLDAEPPTLRVRVGKGNSSRIVPMHRELQAALRSALSYGSISDGKLVDVHSSTAWRWVRAAVRRAEELGEIVPGRKIGTHTLRHSYAHHLLMNGIQINHLSRWLGHSSIQTTLIYLELVPDLSGSLDRVPRTGWGFFKVACHKAFNT